ncbi:hypothetical protein AB0H18_19635 [Streptomyces sp. NPDC020766]|uniref:hypothetical protein n=1 Tax=Streptomyces sp. NPDC020766 TaxID=3155011 RepID=UPI0033C337B5
MSDEQPHRAPSFPRPAQPTLAEFREHLVNFAEQTPAPDETHGRIMRSIGPLFRDAVLRMLIDLVDDYAANHAPAARAGKRIEPFRRLHMLLIARNHRLASRGQGHTDLDRLLDSVADEFTLADVRIIRGMAAALADAMPRIAHKAREEGMSPDEIATESGYTASRITQFIREEKQRRAAGDQ